MTSWPAKRDIWNDATMDTLYISMVLFRYKQTPSAKWEER
jgi:hypothetical protein